jgi:hypothetical protein
MTDYRHELRRFPNIVMPQEIFVKEPKEGGTYTALPYGKRVFVWFTYCKSKNICFVVDGNMIFPAHAAFPSKYALGTILSGILTKRTFTADMLIQGGTTLNDVMNELDCAVYLPTQLKFQKAVESLVPFFDTPYKIQCLKCIHGSTVTFYAEQYMQAHVVPLPTSDMYELHEKGVHLACVDTYKRSVMLNTLFRNISENNDLDMGEESDDDEVRLGPPLKMECRWHYKHKQWVPMICSL